MRYLIFLFFITISCISRSGNPGQDQITVGYFDSIKYARGFTIKRIGKIKILQVFNPWEGAKGIEYKYVLCPKGLPIPPSLQKYPVIHTPIKRIVCLSTTHIALLSCIGKLQTMVGVAGPNYVSDTLGRKLIKEGRISDVGFDQALNYETLVSLKPDIVLAYGIQGETATQYKKLEGLGIKVILNGEYLESTPLGKFEWIKFLAAFYDVSEEASEKFRTVEQEYLHLSELCKSIKDKPKVMCGLPWKGAWYIPGGGTYIARMITDAGGTYLWNDFPQRESIPMNFEKVIERASNATVWINTGSAESMNDIVNEDNRLRDIKPFKHNQVYNNNALTNPTGGNDFWESGITHPHIILKDLIKIFHPELLPTYSLVYYKKLN
jgi:iron complex transport system substrate-binding protein